MPLAKEQKAELITTYRRHEQDTGSPEVQVAMLSERIRQLTQHLLTHKHDQACKRGLLKMVGRRRRLLAYLSRVDLERYQALIQKIGLRH